MNAATQSTTAAILPFPRRKARPRSAPQDAFAKHIEALNGYLNQCRKSGEAAKGLLTMHPTIYAAITAHAATHQIDFNTVACEMIVLGLNHFEREEMFWHESDPGNVIPLQFFRDRMQYDDEEPFAS